MKFIMGFFGLNGYAAGGRIYISLRRDKRLPHGVRRMQTPTLQRCRSSSQKIFAKQIFFGSSVFILVRTAVRLCSHSHISLRYNASLLYPVRPCRGLFVVGLRMVSVLFPRRRVVLFGYTVLLRRSFVLLRSAAFRTVLHPRFAFVQLAFADVEVFEGIAVCLCRCFVFEHIRADHLDERAAFIVAQIGKRLTIEGQKRKVLIPLVQPAALACGAAVCFQIA